jgi:hypothetical protein
VAVPKLMTAIIAWDIEPFIPIAIGAIEAHDVSIDAYEGDASGESKKSSSETHGVLVMVLTC